MKDLFPGTLGLLISSFFPPDPIPGGCNLEFDLDIDPNIYLDYNSFETTIKFAPANLGYARYGGQAPLLKPLLGYS